MTLTALASNPPASAPATPPASAPAKPTPAAQAAASSVTLSPAVKQATRETGVLIPYVQRFAQVGLGAVGALTGAVVGGIAGVAIGAALGASSGYLGRPAHHAAILHPMQHVAGAGAMPAHKGADKLLTRLAGEKAGAIAGKIAGTVVGLATGAAIGALGVAWAGIDVGARLGAKASETLFGAPPACDRSSDKKTYEQGILKKQIPEPTGEINPDSHHFYYINGAMEILRSDAQTNPQVARIYNFLSSDASYHNIMHNGAWDLDTFLGGASEGISYSTFHHFGERFMPGFKNAEWQCRQAYDAASDAWKAGDRKKALYYLGVAVHIPQDLSLPQHSVSGVSYIGKMAAHQMMEGYLESHFDQAKLTGGGRYFPDINTPEEFCRLVQAEAAAQYGDAVKEGWKYVGWATERGIDPMDPPRQGSGGPEFPLEVYKAAGERAQRVTPGFYEMFFRDMEKQGYPI